MAALSYCSHSTTRSCYLFSNSTFVFLTIFSFFLFYLRIFPENSENEIIVFSNPSVEDLEYNLLGIESFNGRLAEKNPCDARHQQDEAFNADRLQQDHPCVIYTIRRRYLQNPSPPDIPLQLDEPEVLDQSAIQSQIILPLLKNKTRGFYIECGAADGEFGSNTLYMERNLNWNGILIEANQKYYDQLLTRNRKAYALHVCLSNQPYPTTVYFREDDLAGKIEEEIDSSFNKVNITNTKNGNLVRLQCFPLYSILLAVGRTQIDYFSVDVEGSETKILKTVPWHRVNIKTLTVEVTSRNMSVVEALVHYMEIKGYKKADLLDSSSYFDLVFVKK